MPALFSRSNFTAVSQSVTERLNLRMMSSGLSIINTQPSGSDLLILFSGFARLMTRAPILGMNASGRVKVSPYTPLKRCPMSLVSSTCCL